MKIAIPTNDRKTIAAHTGKCKEFALFKIRTIDNNIINTKEGNARFKIKRNHLETYKKLIQILNSYEYKNRLIDRKNAEQKLVDFILTLVISNYTI